MEDFRGEEMTIIYGDINGEVMTRESENREVWITNDTQRIILPNRLAIQNMITYLRCKLNNDFQEKE